MTPKGIGVDLKMFALLGLEERETRHLRVKVRGLGQFSDTMKGEESLSKENWKKSTSS